MTVSNLSETDGKPPSGARSDTSSPGLPPPRSEPIALDAEERIGSRAASRGSSVSDTVRSHDGGTMRGEDIVRDEASSNRSIPSGQWTKMPDDDEAKERREHSTIAHEGDPDRDGIAHSPFSSESRTSSPRVLRPDTMQSLLVDVVSVRANASDREQDDASSARPGYGSIEDERVSPPSQSAPEIPEQFIVHPHVAQPLSRQGGSTHRAPTAMSLANLSTIGTIGEDLDDALKHVSQ
jgi:hypothetical protein